MCVWIVKYTQDLNFPVTLQLKWVSFPRCSVPMSHTKAFPFLLGWNKISSRDHGLVEQNLSWLVETESKPQSLKWLSQTLSAHLAIYSVILHTRFLEWLLGLMDDSNHSHHKRSAEPPYDTQWCCSSAECSLKIVTLWIHYKHHLHVFPELAFMLMILLYDIHLHSLKWRNFIRAS